MHLLIMATSRFVGDPPPDADSDLKALLKAPDGETLLSRTLTAAVAAAGFGRKMVVGPEEVRPIVEQHEGLTYLEEGDTDYECFLRGILACADEGRGLVCAAHLPVVDRGALENLAANAPADAAVSLPVYSKAEFKQHYPGVRSAYVKLADGELTAAPAAVVQGAALLRAEPVIRKVFESRSNPMALAGIFGLGIVTKFVSGRLTSEDVRRKTGALLRGQCTVLRTCSPKLALSVTTQQSWEDVRALLAGGDSAPGER